MKVTEISKFTCSVYKFVAPLVLDALKDNHVDYYILQRARSVIATNKRKGFFNGDIAELEVETYHFYTDPKDEKAVYDSIVAKAGLNQEGRGSLCVDLWFLSRFFFFFWFFWLHIINFCINDLWFSFLLFGFFFFFFRFKLC